MKILKGVRVLLMPLAVMWGVPASAQISGQVQIVNTIGTVGIANVITIQCLVTNTGIVSNSFGLGAEIEQGSTVLTQIGQQTVPLNTGSSGTATFFYIVPANWTVGTYTAHVVVWSGTPGESSNLCGTTQNFTVSSPTLTIGGCITYHVDSDNSTLHPPANADDGNIFIYLLPSGPRTNITAQFNAVECCHNPCFSPDGTRIVFMAITNGGALYWTNMNVWVVNLTNNTLSDLGTGQDPHYSPDGQLIVYKCNNQVWTMNADGSNAQALTTTPDEKSGPNYSPDGTRIVYWSSGDTPAPGIWWMASNGTGASPIVTTNGIEVYYPIYRDVQDILYTRWDSTNDEADHIYSYSTNTQSSQRLPINVTGITGINDSDPFAIDSSFIGFSSTRNSGTGYDVYIGNTSSGLVYVLPGANTTNDELGGWYSPFTVIYPPPRFVNINLVGDANVTFTLTGLVGQDYSLLVSSNLTLPLAEWAVIAGGTITGTPFSVEVPLPTNSPAFYRLRMQ